MTDHILPIYESIKEKPRTIDGLVEEIKECKSMVWKKVHALDQLGKINLFKGDSGHWIAYHGPKRNREDVEEEAIENLEAIQK